MAVTVTTVNQTIINDADALANWFSSQAWSAPALEPGIKYQGTNAVGCRVNGVGIGNLMNNPGNQNVSTQHVYLLAFVMHLLETQANGGLRIRFGTNQDTNFGEIFAAGSDSLLALINNYTSLVVDGNRAFDATNGTPPARTAVPWIGLVGNCLTSDGRQTAHCDQIKMLNSTTGYLNIAGGTGVSPGTFAEVASDDKTLGRGYVQQQGTKQFNIIAPLRFGSTTSATEFIDSGKVKVFTARPVAAGFYKIDFLGGVAVANNYVQGSLVGTGITANGIGGGAWLAGDPAVARITYGATVTDYNVIDEFGTTFDGFATMAIKAPMRHISCTYNNCNTITYTAGQLRKATITNSIAAVSSAALDLGDIDPAVDDVRDITVINATNGVNLAPSVNKTYNFRNIRYSGLTKKVRINAPLGRLVTINILDGGDGIANPADLELVGGIVSGNVTINNTVTLTVNTSSAGVAVQGVRVRIENAATGVLIANGETDAAGVFTTSFNFTADVNVRTKIRLKGWRNDRQTGVITAVGYIANFDLKPDGSVDLP